MTTRKEDADLNSFITSHLLKFNGYLVSADSDSYTSDFTVNDQRVTRITLRKPPCSDFDVFEQIFERLEYKPLIDLIKDTSGFRFSSPMNIIDAGGNIGLTSLYFNNLFQHAHVVVVEPDEHNCEILTKNLAQNKVPNYTIIQGGVWKADTNLEIQRDFRDKKDWSVRVTETNSDTGLKGYSIQTLSESANFTVIDILKIDVEGAEANLFENFNLASAFLCKTKFLCIEIHDEFNCRENIVRTLTENNFEISSEGESLFCVNRTLVHSFHGN